MDHKLEPVEILVDGDACPVKAEVYRVSERTGVPAVVVANAVIAVPRDARVRLVVVADTLDAADDWIAEHSRPGTIVVTADVPLASRAVKAGAAVLAPNGKPFTPNSIGMALATRNLMDQLRTSGEITGGPRPFSPRDRSAFLGALDQAITRLRRAGHP
ncbi:YaiI/YqxD family protein [Zavarzinia sp. CC-PAN008]|uniref:YaiI/YqxD family protein n=1 Tax=Zavarzinia sp. CC-PAN008 TaxID=3243332 RepID=UPI003F746CED